MLIERGDESDYSLVDKVSLVYHCEATNDIIQAGVFSREFKCSEARVVWTFKIDEEAIKRIVEIENTLESSLFPGFNTEKYGYYLETGRVPYFAKRRVPDRRRGDIQEILKSRGMEYYSVMGMLKYNHGNHCDNWKVETIPEWEQYLIDRDKENKIRIEYEKSVGILKGDWWET